MANNEKCIFCGGETVAYIENGVKGRLCPECDFSWYLEKDVVNELERKCENIDTDYKELEKKYADEVDTDYQEAIANLVSWKKFLDGVCNDLKEG